MERCRTSLTFGLLRRQSTEEEEEEKRRPRRSPAIPPEPQQHHKSTDVWTQICAFPVYRPSEDDEDEER